MKEAISIFILLFFPIMYKMVKNWRGTVHPNKGEFEGLSTVIIICAITVRWANIIFFDMPLGPNAWGVIKYLIKAILVSACGFQLIFPYLINWRMSHLYGYGPESRIEAIFKHLSDVAVPDKYKWYRKIGWLGRLSLWIILFTLSLIWFL